MPGIIYFYDILLPSKGLNYISTQSRNHIELECFTIRNGTLDSWFDSCFDNYAYNLSDGVLGYVRPVNGIFACMSPIKNK